MKDIGTILPLLTGVTDMQATIDSGGALLVVVKNEADRNDIENVVGVLQDQNITGIVAIDRCLKEIRSMSPGDLIENRKFLDDALVQGSPAIPGMA